MNYMKKVSICGIFLSLCALSALSAQQITRFGVVDTSRVYAAFFRDTGPVRNYERKRDEFQKEINKQTDELKKLQNQKIEYEKSGNSVSALRVEAEITKKTEYVTQYTAAKNLELETLKKNLQSSDAFYAKLYAALAKIAESEGYSLILSLQQSNGILWYSPAVDVTDSVINELGL